MENIEIGEYVRVNSDFRTICIGIGKVVNKNQNTIYVSMSNNNLPISFNVNQIVKHGKQLENLIEVNDIVNGYRILEIYEATETNEERILDIGYGQAIFNNEIKTILTKEQMEANCYKVGGEDE